MLIALTLVGVLLTLAGSAYELALLALSRAELAEAVTRRLRGGSDRLAWPVHVEREVAAASATTAIGVITLGVLFPALISGDSVPELLGLLALLAIPAGLLNGYLLPRWLTHDRAERLVHWLRPAFRPWSVLLRAVLPAPSDVTGEFRALSAAMLPDADDEMAMVGGVMTFAERPVREVMTPRTDLVAVQEGAGVAEIARTFAESGYSRIPVYRETLDDIIGMVHAFDLFTLAPGEPLPIRPVALAPASRSCGDLLLDMQRERRHLAVVLDEFGGTLGIVTLEDLLTALVGEIYDEDEVVVGATVPRGLLEADGSLSVEDVEGRFGVTLPPGHASTIGGRLAELAGRIPLSGERLALRGLEFDILHATPARIERLVIRAGSPAMQPLERPPA